MTVDGPAHRSLAGRAGGPILALLIVAALAQALAHLVPTWLRDDVFVGDAAQHTWWLARFADPTLFPSDPIATYYALPAYSPPGYQLIFRLFAGWATPQRTAEGVAVLLGLAAVGLAAWLGARVGKKTGAAAAVAVLVATHGEQLVEGGFPRSFGLVLVLAGMLALYRRSWGVLGLILVAAPLFYAPTVLNLAPATAIVIALGVRRHKRWPRGFGPLVLLAAVTVGLIAWIYLTPPPSGVGRWFTFAEARHMAERGRHGRTTFFYPWRSYYFTSPVSGVGLSMTSVAVAAVALALTVLWRPRAIVPEAWALLAAAVAMWAMAHALLFHLYLPSRYTTYALPVFAMMWAAGLGRDLKLFVQLLSGASGRWLRAGVVAAACAAGVLALLRSGHDARAAVRAPGTMAMWASPGFDAVLPTLSALPPGTLLAAHPNDANAIPLLTRHSVLVNTETSIAFHTDYYAEMRRRLEATFAMLYATDWSEIDAIAGRYHVGVFVLDTARLTDPDRRPYYAPFADENRRLIDAGRAAGYAMLAPPPERVLFRSGGWVVLRVGGGVP